MYVLLVGWFVCLFFARPLLIMVVVVVGLATTVIGGVILGWTISGGDYQNIIVSSYMLLFGSIDGAAADIIL